MSTDKLRVMISSRCKPYQTEAGETFPLDRLRQSIKDELDAAHLLGQPLFECWINEQEPAKPATLDVWDECMKAVRQAQIVIALYNGDAGWCAEGGDGGELGICHAELSTALQTGRDRVFMLNLPLAAECGEATDRRFQEFVRQELSFNGPAATDDTNALAKLKQTVAEAVALLAREGSSQLRKSSYALGQALAWSRMSFAERKREMEKTVGQALLERFASTSPRSLGEFNAGGLRLLLQFETQVLLMTVHAIPAPMTTAAAREMVGRPFLSDHKVLQVDEAERPKTPLGKALKFHGPVHLIACHRGVTEKQATDMLGFPDATVVSTGFGVYVLDPVQRVQLILLANCRDASSSRYAVQRFFDWLKRSAQAPEFIAHAKARSRIVRAIQKEQA
ncbi:hypothetical protein HNP55_002791 [Paucibacter oligotrophus]|uniref:DUF4062 domain-containing protein n=1 Tax=Roseateles oligotrophus TaxID=1769250 RepID=A0A840LBM0_9BURK|nr:hypothetical protein [Roseateles oligotrophus]MBB4844255.1 hypothetical protein [Roseateles oligotrophus]